ncbi:MAG: OmpH family outer membrane protein [Veillonella sp.]|uniref:OmpH family outer membrane protein n=1 Tax=Veillonella sp. TaxID=1926307 RepID=UPI0025E7CB64|nr:OmpH family outer membrane protein [Veillonella sp.]MBS4913170.1 OmpH family outer membrane protein [Veillonella sp.]
MNFKKKIATLAVLGTIGLSAVAGAATIGVVNMSQVMQAYPGFGALQMQAQKVDAEYGPKLQKTANEINALKDDAAKQDAYTKKYEPVLKKYDEEMNKIYAPVDQIIKDNLEKVRAEKNIQIIVADPRVVVSAEPNTTIEDVTPDLVNAVRAAK